MQVDAGQVRRAGLSAANYINTTHDLAIHVHQAAATGAALVNTMQQQQDENNIGALVSQYGTLNLAPGNMASGAAMPNIPHNAFINGADGNIVFAAAPYAGHMPTMMAPEHAAAYSTYPMAYGPAGYAPAFAPGPMLPYTPGRVPFGDRLPRDVPALENRRGSYSTSATESTPTTPFFGHAADRLNGTRVASLDRSAYTTPSPRETMSHFMNTNSGPKALVDPELERLLMQDPPVPKAVPAVWTDHIKPIEQCLENRIQGNRNVYIRGLHPTTDDELLLKYAARFGEVEQSKAIIDTTTGACKGYVATRAPAQMPS